ncbi:hypothetical protein GmHk_13G036236 [Glycine max]|nr:hypothetical protein GmHk_13G036236 [Glycine max]
MDNTCCIASLAFLALALVIGPPSPSSGSLPLLLTYQGNPCGVYPDLSSFIGSGVYPDLSSLFGSGVIQIFVACIKHSASNLEGVSGKRQE